MTKKATLFLCAAIVTQLVSPLSTETVTEAVLTNPAGTTINVPQPAEGEQQFELGKYYQANFAITEGGPVEVAESSASEQSGASSESEEKSGSSDQANPSESNQEPEKQAA